MAQIDQPALRILAAPLNKIASLLGQTPAKLVPFKANTVAAALSDPTKASPAVNFTISGIPLVISAIGGPGLASLPLTLEDVIVHLATFNLGGVVSDLAELVGDAANIVGHQASLALSFLTVMQNAGAKSGSVAQEVARAYQQYFFDDTGYQTLEGAAISPPSLRPAGGGAMTVADLRKYLTRQTAEQYTRDLVQITAEASGNALFNLLPRYLDLQARKDAKAERWFKGYASLAESAVTSAVEEALLGVALFTGNPVFAAAVGTFAGTAAKKATQAAFLAEIGIPENALAPVTASGH
ncbi:MAG TPA: hypothetical protein VJN94_08395 [Candidatus Binataceae bacterium]|nr:hypothetical protein [Candidatus Binataceae bacterium]